MHIVRSAATLQLPYGQVLPPGEWLMQDDTAFACAVRAERGTVELMTTNSMAALGARGVPANAFSNKDPKSILLIRSGAIGDLLLLSPCIIPLKQKYPEARIFVCCYSKHTPIISDWPIQGGVTYPPRAASLSDYDLIIPLENVIELATEKGVHATDAFAEALGVTVVDYRPVYRVAENESVAAIRDGDPINHKPRVGIQIHASSRIRGYPMQQWNAVLVQLIARGWEIMLLGNQDGIKGAPPAIKDCSGLTFREAAAVLATCDVFCGVDSAFFNLCPALDVPAIGLFGPVDWATRVREGSGQFALTTHAECAPCGWTNSRAGRQWPEGMPCEKAGACVPLANIPPERIVAKIDQYRK